MDIFVVPLLNLLITLLSFFKLLIIVRVVMSWLEAFNIINHHNHFMIMVNNFLFRATEPAMAFIRRILPQLGHIDLSPFVLILVLHLLQEVLARFALRFL